MTLAARKNRPEPQAELSASGKHLEALKAEIHKSLPVVAEQKKAALQQAREAVKKAGVEAKDAKAEDEAAKLKAVIGNGSQEKSCRSSERYWIASSKSVARMLGAPARSASVRATLRIRSWARAEKFISSIACSR